MTRIGKNRFGPRRTRKLEKGGRKGLSALFVFRIFSLFVILLLRLIAFDPMVSRKKAKGRARRAAKEANMAEEGKVGDKAAAVANQDTSLEAQMQLLTIGIKCRHGFEVKEESEKLCIIDFMKTFGDEYRARARSGESDMVSCFKAGMDATWDRSDGLERISCCWKTTMLPTKLPKVHPITPTFLSNT